MLLVLLLSAGDGAGAETRTTTDGGWGMWRGRRCALMQGGCAAWPQRPATCRVQDAAAAAGPEGGARPLATASESPAPGRFAHAGLLRLRAAGDGTGDGGGEDGAGGRDAEVGLLRLRGGVKGRRRKASGKRRGGYVRKRERRVRVWVGMPAGVGVGGGVHVRVFAQRSSRARLPSPPPGRR